MNLNCLTESLIRVAPDPLGRKFEPGDGFAARQGGDWIPWEQTSVTHKGRDAWEFVQNSADGLSPDFPDDPCVSRQRSSCLRCRMR